MSVQAALRIIQRAEQSDMPLSVHRNNLRRAEFTLFDARRYRDMARASALLDK